jgi:hypothetical protein
LLLDDNDSDSSNYVLHAANFLPVIARSRCPSRGRSADWTILRGWELCMKVRERKKRELTIGVS